MIHRDLIGIYIILFALSLIVIACLIILALKKIEQRKAMRHADPLLKELKEELNLKVK